MAELERVPRSHTFTGAARRRQLVDAAIELIAEVGLPTASTVRIAMRAGVSRGVLTHHFSGRDELLDAIVAEVYEVGRREVAPAVVAALGAREKVLAFVDASVRLYEARPAHLAALSEILAERGRGGRDARAREARHGSEIRDVTALLTQAQRAGEMRSFDAETMAHVIRSMLDAALVRIRDGADGAALREEIVATVDAATRQEAG